MEIFPNLSIKQSRSIRKSWALSDFAPLGTEGDDPGQAGQLMDKQSDRYDSKMNGAEKSTPLRLGLVASYRVILCTTWHLLEAYCGWTLYSFQRIIPAN